MTRLNRLNLWTLEKRRNRADLIELFKIYIGLSGIKIESMFEPSTDSRTRGHALKLKKHRSRLDLRKYFFSENVVNRWNELHCFSYNRQHVQEPSATPSLAQDKLLHGHLVFPKLQGLIWRKSIFFLVRPHLVIHQVLSFWMTANLLTLNTSKIDFFLIGLKQQLANNCSIETTHSARNLEIIFDEHLTFSDQISSLSKSCYSHICALRSIRPYLDFKTASTTATSIVHSKLDYCNSLYSNLPNSQINRLQQI